MPVIDHPVSDITKRTGSEPYSCSNSKREHGYWTMIRRFNTDGSYSMSSYYIVDNMSKDCKYDHKNDPRCSGCVK